MLTCRELVEIVTDYFDDALPPRERLRFEKHLVVCPECKAHLAQMRETVRLTGALHEEQLSEEACESLLGAFRDWKRGAL